jgi:serine phosphatase RsbU (regulator of sigma subunit)
LGPPKSKGPSSANQRALRGAREYAERRLVAEHAVTRILAESAEIINAAPRMMQAICECLGWNLGLVWIVDGEANVLRCVDVWQGPTGDAPAFAQANRESTFAEGAGLPGRVWESRHPAWIPDVTQDPGFHQAAIAAEEGLHGAYGFPIFDGVELLGVMEFFSREMLRADEELLEMMAVIGGQIGQFLEHRRAEQTVRERDVEFALARRIQQSLQPKAVPTLPGFEFAGASKSCQETGGDYYDFLSFGDSSVGVAIGDASGHGIGAALVMTETRASLRALSLTHADPGTILSLTNHWLATDLPPDHFISAFLARLDRTTRTRVVLRSNGMPLGFDVAAEFPTAPQVTLLPGDLLLLFTDGLTEARSPAGSLFGIERVLNVLRTHRHERPGGLVEALYRAVADFSGNRSPADDITAVIVEVEATA